MIGRLSGVSLDSQRTAAGSIHHQETKGTKGSEFLVIFVILVV
jgi:hypothetical protein